MSKSRAPSLIASLTRQICLEEGCAIWMDRDDEGNIVQDDRALSAMAGLEVSIVHIPELRGLRKACSRLFVRQDPFNFRVVAVRRLKKKDFDPPITLDGAVALGEKFLGLTGKMNGSKVPVVFDLIELHADGIAEDYESQIADFNRRGIGKPKVAVMASAISEDDGRVMTNSPALGKVIQTRRLARAYARRGEDVDTYRLALERAGFNPLHAIVGALGGGLGTLLTLLALGAAGVESGYVFGGAMTIVCISGAVVSVFMSKIRSQATAQALAGGLGAFALAAGVWLGIGGGLSIDLLVIGGVVGMMSLAIGMQSNTVGPKRSRGRRNR